MIKQNGFLWGLMLFCLLMLPQAQGFSDSESFAVARATVVGFEPGFEEGGFITLHIDEIIEYSPSPESDSPPPESNTTYTFGYLWGHTPVKGSFLDLGVGSRITANLSFHYQFTSHVGHMYGYELICGEDEILTEEGCAPESCANNEVLAGIKCVPLDCRPDQGYRNHTCYNLECETDEKIEDHRCRSLVCSDDEFAANHYCQKLDCDINEVAKDHNCIPLVCGVFRKVDNSVCVLDGSQLIIFIALTFIVLYLIYVLLIKDIFSEKSKGDRMLANRIGILLVFFISLVLLAIPAISRLIFHSSLLIGAESYRNQLIAEKLIEGTMGMGLFGEASLYHMLLAYLGSLFGLNLVAHALPILLGTFSATLFYLIMRRIINDVRMSTLTTMVLIFSPAFLYLFSVSSPSGLIALFLLVGVYLALSSRKFLVFSGGLLMALVSTYDPFVFALSLVAFLMIIINTKNSRRLRVGLLIIIWLVGLLSTLFIYDFNRPITSFRSDFVRGTITDLGGIAGFGIFHVLLFFSGLLYTWAKKKEYTLGYIFMILLFALMLALDTNYYTHLNFVIAFFIGFALSRFADSKWENPQLKNLALLILFCGLLFSTVSYAKRMSMMGPEPGLVDELSRFSDYPKGIVLSHPSNSDYIAYFSGMEPYIQPGEAEAAERWKNAEELFQSRRLDSAIQFLDSENIPYILVDRDMRQGGVWQREDQGMLFLFRNNETFRKLFGKEVTAEVWEFLPRGTSGQSN